MDKFLAEIKNTVLPQLYCPLVPAVNSQVEWVQARTMQWALEFQLVQPQSKQLARLSAVRSGRLAAMYFPSLALDTLQLAADWMTWAFCCDDLCDGTHIGCDPQQWWSIADRLLKIVKGEPRLTQGGPVDDALGDICQRLRHIASALWLARFTESVKHYFQATQWEATIHAQGITPDLATYTKMRRYTGGAYTCFDLLGMASALNPQAAYLSHAYVKQLEVMASNHIGWVNDLFSLAKELEEGNRKNLVLVLQQEYQLILPEAVKRAVAMCNAEMKAFLNLAAMFSAENDMADPHFQCYMSGLGACIRANLDWHVQTGRYQVESRKQTMYERKDHHEPQHLSPQR